MKCKKSIFLLLVMVLLFPSIQCSQIDSDWLEDEKVNNEIQPPEEVMNLIGVKEGMVVGEFGAGYGRYTLHLAKKIGGKGIIYANEIDESALLFLNKRCKEAGLKNVKTILGKADDPLFPKNSLDMAFSTLVYHEMDNPVPFMKNLKLALKPNATVVIVDFDPEKGEEWIKSGRSWKSEVEQAGYEIVKIEKLHERDIIIILKPKVR